MEGLLTRATLEIEANLEEFRIIIATMNSHIFDLSVHG